MLAAGTSRPKVPSTIEGPVEWQIRHLEKMVATKPRSGVAILASLFAANCTAFHSSVHLPQQHYGTESRLRVHEKEQKDEEEIECRRQSGTACAPDRRECLHRLSSSVLGAVGLFSHGPALAADEISQEMPQRMVFDRRPAAPMGALLPATEQRTLLKTCLGLSRTLRSQGDEGESTSTKAAIRQLETILVDPNGEGSEGYNYYTRGLTEKKRSERDRKLLARYQQSDTRKLSGNVIRGAMNIYVSNLRYGREYTVRDAAWKSDYIRANDGLPDYRRLVQADLDLRILYMNEVQIRVDDAAAEFYAAFGSGDGRVDVDGGELRRLLQSAADSMDAWFALIDAADADEASRAVAEGKSLQVVDNSFAAGFVPPSGR